MPDYSQQEVVGIKWTRCNRIVIHNPHSSLGLPVVQFGEEDALALPDDKVMIMPSAKYPIPAMIFDPAAVIDLYNPITGEPLGATITLGEVYALLFSAYMTQALKRDAMPPAPPYVPVLNPVVEETPAPPEA